MSKSIPKISHRLTVYLLGLPVLVLSSPVIFVLWLQDMFPKAINFLADCSEETLDDFIALIQRNKK